MGQISAPDVSFDGNFLNCDVYRMAVQLPDDGTPDGRQWLVTTLYIGEDNRVMLQISRYSEATDKKVIAMQGYIDNASLVANLLYGAAEKETVIRFKPVVK